MAGLPRPRRSRSVRRSAGPGNAAVLHAGREDGLQRRPAERLCALPSLAAVRDVCLEREASLPRHHAGSTEHGAAAPDLHARGAAVRVGGAPAGLILRPPTVARDVGGRGGGGVRSTCWRSLGRAVRAAEREQAKTGDAHELNDAPAGPFCRPWRGSAAVNVVPCPFERTSMLPPCARTICCTMKSPSPSPPARASPRRPGSKTCASTSRGMGGPPLLVSSTTKSVSPWSVTVTSPSLCCSAFPTRLEITCAMRSGSQSPHRSPCASTFTCRV